MIWFLFDYLWNNATDFYPERIGLKALSQNRFIFSFTFRTHLFFSFFFLRSKIFWTIVVSRVINLLLTKLARDRTGRISALGLLCTHLAALGAYCQDLGPIFSQSGSPRAWLTRYIYIYYKLSFLQEQWTLGSWLCVIFTSSISHTSPCKLNQFY